MKERHAVGGGGASPSARPVLVCSPKMKITFRLWGSVWMCGPALVSIMQVEYMQTFSLGGFSGDLHYKVDAWCKVSSWRAEKYHYHLALVLYWAQWEFQEAHWGVYLINRSFWHPDAVVPGVHWVAMECRKVGWEWITNTMLASMFDCFPRGGFG